MRRSNHAVIHHLPQRLLRVGPARGLALALALSGACSGSQQEPLPPNTYGLKDSDRDGLYDPGTSTKRVDQCPTVAGPIKNNGCPYTDRDNDGVFDHIDRCPDAPGKPAYTGCPDRDNDGVIGERDRCPDVAGPKRERGCPDLDGDGVLAPMDKCPEQPETKNGLLDEDGCPDAINEPDASAVAELHGRELRFEGDRDGIPNATAQVLDSLFRYMIENPELRLELTGHADVEGYNAGALQQLGWRRAEAVKRYFVERGVAGDRFTTKGEAPTSPGTTPGARADNNHVRITVLPAA